jgi:hypothetical protein
VYGAAVAVYTSQAKKIGENVPIRIIPGPLERAMDKNNSAFFIDARIRAHLPAQPWTDHVDRSGIRANNIVAVGPLRSCCTHT